MMCKAKSHTADTYETHVVNYSNYVRHEKEMVVSMLVL
jgi:hypothetical protein